MTGTDGTVLASGSEDGTIKLWDPATWQMRGTLHDLGAGKSGLPAGAQEQRH